MDYEKTLKDLEIQIENVIHSIVYKDENWSPRNEERLTSLCLGRSYIKDKLRESAFIELNKINVEMVNDEIITQVVSHEG